jgi:hypothetical protein
MDRTDWKAHDLIFFLLKVTEGFLGPFSSIELDFYFTPSFPGKFNQDFVIDFEDPDSKEVHFISNPSFLH